MINMEEKNWYLLFVFPSWILQLTIFTYVYMCIGHSCVFYKLLVNIFSIYFVIDFKELFIYVGLLLLLLSHFSRVRLCATP